MRRPLSLAIALTAFGCSHPSTMTSSEIPTQPSSASVESTLPGFDRDAADIIRSGKFETATFALG